MVRSSKTSQTFWSAACSTRRRFKVFRATWEKLLGVSLPWPSLSGADSSSKLSSFKSFCSGLIERRSHIWNETLSGGRVSRDSRMSIAHSLFLFRKCLYTDAPSVPDFIRKISTPDGDPDPLFMEYLRNEVPRLFNKGWDRQYPQRCLNSTVPTKSCAERGRMYGGSRGLILDRSCGWEEARADFVESVLSSMEPRLGGEASRVVAVPTSGKWRVLTVPPVDMNRLRPLHETIYNHCSRFKWLMRGDAKPSSFKDFCAKEGELFASGDYEDATNNLNSGVQKEILRLVLQSASNIPKGIVVDAMRSFDLELVYRSEGQPPCVGKQRRGQMMGNLLSFPLLCLVNYLTFRYLTMDESIPVKINGDDIVFRAAEHVVKRWMDGVGASGLVLSRGKTMLDARYFTLNSLLFKGKEKGCVAIPFVRSRTLFGMEDSESPIGGLAGRFRSFAPGFFGRRRVLLRAVFLRENSGWINRSCRSLMRGLGVNVTAADLKESGLWARELRYLALPSEKALPPTFSVWSQVPEGFEIGWRNIDRKKCREQDQQLSEALREAAWKPARQVTMKEYTEAWFGGSDLSDRSCASTSSRFDRLAKLTKMTHAYVRSRLRFSALAWAFASTSSYDSWCVVRDSRTIVPDSLWQHRLDQRIRTQTYYKPVARPIEFTGSSGTYTVSTIRKFADLDPIDEDVCSSTKSWEVDFNESLVSTLRNSVPLGGNSPVFYAPPASY